MIKALAVFLVLGTVYAETTGIGSDEPVVHPGIVRGENSRGGEFSVMVTLRLKLGNQYVCDGTVLTSNWALTAARCCDFGNKSNLIIATGHNHDELGMTVYAIDKIVVHEKYSPSEMWRNDICLVRVSQAFKLGDQVNQITLPTQDWPVKSGDKLVVYGWGYAIPTKPQTYPNRPRTATRFTALSNDECGRETGTPMFPGYLCARKDNKRLGASNSFSGSPMVKDGVQVGITSLIYLSSASVRPDIFCRVPHYSNWIKNVLGSEAGQLKFVK